MYTNKKTYLLASYTVSFPMKKIRAYFLFPSTHPLFYILIGLVGGIYCQYVWNSFIYLYTSLVLLLACFSFSKKTLFSTTTIVLLSATVGAYLYSIQIKQERDFYAATQMKKYTIYGEIEDIQDSSHQYLKTKIILKIIQVFNKNDATLSKVENSPLGDKRIQIYVPYKQNVQIGDVILLNELMFTRPKKDEYRRYLIKEQIAATVFLNNFNPFIVYRPATDLSRWLMFHKKRILSSFCKKYPDARAYLFSSIFLGNKTEKTEYADIFKEQCTVWGINHYLARSGLHLIIFIMLWSRLFSFIPLSYNTKQLALTFLALFYALLSWPSVSFNRALYVFILYKLCIIRSEQPHFLYLLSLVSCIVLVNNPIILFSLDFQLSFGITFALAWYNQLQKQKGLLIEGAIS